MQKKDILVSNQLFQARLKSNDFLQEHLKQLITISSATLVLTITFLNDLLKVSDGEVTFFWLLPTAWIALVVSIILSLLNIALLVNNLDIANKEKGRDGNYPKAFAAGQYSWLGKLVLIALGAFCIGMAALGAFGSFNHRLFVEKSSEQYNIILETKAIEIAKSNLETQYSYDYLDEVNAELIIRPKEYPKNLIVWHIRLNTVKSASSGKHGSYIQYDYYIDGFSGRLIKSDRTETIR